MVTNNGSVKMEGPRAYIVVTTLGSIKLQFIELFIVAKRLPHTATSV